MPSLSVSEMSAAIDTVWISDWITVSQERIDQFAQATGDHQFIHTDPVRAAMTPFGGTIAHGFLTLSLLPALAETAGLPQLEGLRMAVNYGGNRVRFLTPVRSGKRVRGNFRLIGVEDRGGNRVEQIMELTVEIEGEKKPAMVAEWITLAYI